MTAYGTTAALRMHIGGEWVAAASGAELESVDPATEQVLGTVPEADADDVEAAVVAAREAAPAWRDLGWKRRAALLRELSARIAEQAEDLARLDVRDSGNPLAGMRSDVTAAVDELDYYAGIASQTGGTTGPPATDTMSWTEHEPYGVVGRIVPFNHPFKSARWQGGSAARRRQRRHRQAGRADVDVRARARAHRRGRAAARGAQRRHGPRRDSGRRTRRPPRRPAHRLHRVRALMSHRPAGRRQEIKHVSLELGGKNPIVVFPDVDPVRAARAAVAGMNIARCTGQSCGSTSRLFVHDDVRGPFVEALVARLAELRIGDPMDEDEGTEVGPLAFRAHHERVLSYVESGRREGATLVHGGERPSHLMRGFFLEPTVFTDVDDGMTIAREEIFGPVMSVLHWRDWDDVVARANATRLGLTANVWTNDVSTAIRTARALEAGYVYVNGSGRRPAGMPFGGWKHSGLGKENGLQELLSYTREKSVTVTLL
jgi:betaine-aldehyde dehydrogenase